MHEHSNLYASTWRTTWNTCGKFLEILLKNGKAYGTMASQWLVIEHIIGTCAKQMEDMGKHLGVPQSMQFDTCDW